MEQTPLQQMSLRQAHDAIRELLQGRVSDWENTESHMTKTPNGYIFEIVYKGSPVHHLNLPAVRGE